MLDKASMPLPRTDQGALTLQSQFVNSAAVAARRKMRSRARWHREAAGVLDDVRAVAARAVRPAAGPCVLARRQEQGRGGRRCGGVGRASEWDATDDEPPWAEQLAAAAGRRGGGGGGPDGAPAGDVHAGIVQMIHYFVCRRRRRGSSSWLQRAHARLPFASSAPPSRALCGRGLVGHHRRHRRRSPFSNIPDVGGTR